MEKREDSTNREPYILQMSDPIESILIKTPTQFMQEIEKLVSEKNMEWIDAVVHFCQKNNIEVETAASLIKGSPKMKAFIQFEGEQKNLLPKSGKLPI
jgi:hypothetical protein